MSIALLASAALPAGSSTAGAGVGSLTLTHLPCSPDTVPFAMTDTQTGSWAFVVLDIGPVDDTDRAYAAPGVLLGEGSPEAGFAGPGVFSGPWSISGVSFSVTELTFKFQLPFVNQTLEGTASGVIA